MPSILTAINLTHGGTLTQATSYNTNSITPSANNLIILSVESLFSSGTPNTPTVTGASMTWVQVATSVLNHTRITVFRSMSSSPGSGALTIDFGGQTQHDINYSIDSISGCDTSGSNGSGAIVQSPTNTSTATSGSLGMANLQNPNNLVYGALGLEAGGLIISPGSGWTQLFSNANGSSSAETQYAINKTSITWTWGGTSQNFAAIGVEIKQKNVFPGFMI